jgi:hypothetical protein
MKIRIALVGVLLLLILVSFLFLRYRQPMLTITAVAPTNTATSGQTTFTTTPRIAVSSNTNIPPPDELVKMRLERLKQRQIAIDHADDEWRTPIEFYGRVVDESNNVIPGAQVDFGCNDISITGTSYYHAKSDANGSFSIKNIKGKLLGVNVGKNGYYSYDPHGQDFYYAGQNQNFVPDAGNPVVFRLRKKGKGANLIHYDKSFKLPRDGAPIQIDLATGNLSSTSENTMKVEGWTHDNEKKQGWKYDWRCRVSFPGGGFQTNLDHFPFLAPETDYASEDLIEMPVTNNAGWSYIVHRNYYVHTAGGNFGRMIFTMVAGGDNFCEVNLFFNPSGSRNLEPAR